MSLSGPLLIPLTRSLWRLARARFARCSSRAIDINSQSSRIEEANFLSADFEPGAQDAIVCSMVLNCVPNADLRGDMIKKVRHHECQRAENTASSNSRIVGIAC